MDNRTDSPGNCSWAVGVSCFQDAFIVIAKLRGKLPQNNQQRYLLLLPLLLRIPIVAQRLGFRIASIASQIIFVALRHSMDSHFLGRKESLSVASSSVTNRNANSVRHLRQDLISLQLGIIMSRMPCFESSVIDTRIHRLVRFSLSLSTRKISFSHGIPLIPPGSYSVPFASK